MSDTPDPDELREAQALARALEGTSDAGAPADALETAALLRYARRNDPAKEQLARALGAATGARVRPRVIWAASALAAAAALAVAWLPSPAPEPSLSAPELPPSPREELVAAQGRVLAAPERDLTELVRATDRRRRALFVGLGARYGGEP
jgi:hypothetical protein